MKIRNGTIIHLRGLCSFFDVRSNSILKILILGSHLRVCNWWQECNRTISLHQTIGNDNIKRHVAIAAWPMRQLLRERTFKFRKYISRDAYESTELKAREQQLINDCAKLSRMTSWNGTLPLLPRLCSGFHMTSHWFVKILIFRSHLRVYTSQGRS